MESHKVSDIVQNKLNWEFFLPSIQREFVWSKGKIEKLFDSLMQEYPIGTVLTWNYQKRNSSITEKAPFEVYKFIENFDFENNDNLPASLNGLNRFKLVLDGQQRLSALLIGLKGSYRFFYYKPRQAKLYLNLFKLPDKHVDDNPDANRYEFRFLENPQMGENHYWMEVGKVLDYSSLSAEDFKDYYQASMNEYTSDSEKIKEAKKSLGQLHHVICKNPVLPENTVSYDENEEEKILNVFVRTNDTGVRLEKADLLLSYMEAEKELFQPSGARKEVKEFVENLNKEEVNKPNYGFQKDDILKASLVLSDLPVQYKLSNFNKENLRSIDKNWLNIKFYLDLTARLFAQYGFESQNIVSKNGLIPISYFMMSNNYGERFLESNETQDIRIKDNLIRWYVISGLKGAFGNSSDSTLNNVRKEINYEKPFYEITMGAEVNEDDLENWLERERYKSKYSHLLLMLVNNRKFWKNAHQDHVFPASKFSKDYLKNECNLDDEKAKQIQQKKDSLMNIQLLNGQVNISKFKDLPIEWLSKQESDFLNSQAIPELSEYLFSNFLSFIEARKSLMKQRLAEALGVIIENEAN